MCCMRLAGNAGPKKSPKICHLRAVTQLCRAISSQLRHISTIGKKLVIPPPHVPTIWWTWPTTGWDLLASLDTPGNFNGFRVLAALLYGTLVVGVSQTLQSWTEGTNQNSAGRPSRWTFVHILVIRWNPDPSRKDLPRRWGVAVWKLSAGWSFYGLPME